MNDDSNAWRLLQKRAADQLRGDFADRVLRVNRGPTDEAWRELNEVAADQLRLGFANRVLLAVRRRVPSLVGQLAFSAAVAAACMATVIIFHDRQVRQQEEQNLAQWRDLGTDTQYFAYRQ